MSIGLSLAFAPIVGIILVLALAVMFTRLWLNDTTTQALRELKSLGIQPGRRYKLGSAWALLATQDYRNVLWALLALVAWVTLIVAVDVHLVSWQRRANTLRAAPSNPSSQRSDTTGEGKAMRSTAARRLMRRSAPQ